MLCVARKRRESERRQKKDGELRALNIVPTGRIKNSIKTEAKRTSASGLYKTRRKAAWMSSMNWRISSSG
jgi:hypothetical protein